MTAGLIYNADFADGPLEPRNRLVAAPITAKQLKPKLSVKLKRLKARSDIKNDIIGYHYMLLK